MSELEMVQKKYQILKPFMNERMRRLWAASEAIALGRGGQKLVAAATGMARITIRSGVREFQRLGLISDTSEPLRGPLPIPIAVRRTNRTRRAGAGNRAVEVRDPGIIPALDKLLECEVAGDPMNEKRWVRSSLSHLSKQLKETGHQASPHTVRRLLKVMGFSLKGNERKQGQSRTNHPERDEQFRYVASQRESFSSAGLPIISVDTKKKELIGNFRNKGKTWCKKADEVDEHDFPSAAECRSVPFGIYDMLRNKGHVYVGVSNDTPEFAVASIAKWWEREGRSAYPRADRLLILADGGGSNGCRARAWKCNLQCLVSNRFGLTLTVCHYPTGCSKWNPVEHRLFSYISINWAGKPLRSLEIMLGYIRGTRTEAGLEVEAFLDEGFYKKSVPYSHKDVDGLCLETHQVCPQWNYTISPQPCTPRQDPGR
jgi:Rhodopirellula transposase DDE domain